jgi:hypothetical protein
VIDCGHGHCDCAIDFVTITITRELALDLATYWQPCKDDDPMVELFEAC